MRPSLSSILSTFLLSSLVTAHNINLGAHSRECFHEQLHKDDKMTVTFQVGDREFGGAGNLEVDFWVRGWGKIQPRARVNYADIPPPATDPTPPRP